MPSRYGVKSHLQNGQLFNVTPPIIWMVLPHSGHLLIPEPADASAGLKHIGSLSFSCSFVLRFRPGRQSGNAAGPNADLARNRIAATCRCHGAAWLRPSASATWCSSRTKALDDPKRPATPFRRFAAQAYEAFERTHRIDRTFFREKHSLAEIDFHRTHSLTSTILAVQGNFLCTLYKRCAGREEGAR